MRRRRIVAAAGLAVLMVLGWRGCRKDDSEAAPTPVVEDTMIVTGYCNCRHCCGWRRSWFGFGPPVYNYGPMKGKRKHVGITASGAEAHRGTIAADPSVFAFGTVLEVPGYGRGTVEDIGGSIKGRHIDVWFPSHAEAVCWGTQRLKVKVIGK